MTEAEFRSVPRLTNLPLYFEDDPRCPEIDFPDPQTDTSFTGTVMECETVDEALALLADPGYEPRGGIRFDPENGEMIRAYFWKCR